MTDDTLTPATGAELITALVYGLRFDGRGKAHRHATELAAHIAAEALVMRCALGAGPRLMGFTSPACQK